MEDIVGAPFSNWVKRQIDKRQEILGKSQRSPEEIQFLSNKNSWIRVASSVNLTEDIADDQIKDQNLLSDTLAKGFILFGGITPAKDNPNNILTYQSPLGGVVPSQESRNSFLDSSKYSYGFGSSEYGYTPPPGINSLKVTHQNRGSIRKYVLKLKAQNLDQFRIIDALYLRLGYYILVEWGHTSYFTDGEGEGEEFEFKGTPEYNTGAFTALFNGSKDDIIQQLKNDRQKSSGNYDGGLAKISNFSWVFNGDGSYDITINAVSIGGIIDSLIMNFPGNSLKVFDYPSNFVIKNLTPEEEIKIANDLGEQIPNDHTTDTAFLGVVKNFISKGKLEELLEAGVLEDSETTIGGTPLNTLNYDEYAGTIFSNQYKSVLNNKLLNDVLTLKNADWIKYNDINRYKKIGNLLAIKFESGDSKKKDRENYYLTLGSLFSFITETILKLNFSQPGTTDEELKEVQPLIGLEYLNEIFTHPCAGSSDPYTCLVPFEFPPYEGFDNPVNSFLQTIIPDKFRTSPELPFVGVIGDIYVNMECIAEILDALEAVDPNNNIRLFEFLNELMFRIQISLGNINEFTVTYNETSNKIVIQDDTKIPGLVESKIGEDIEPTQLRVYGVNTLTPQGSFIKNVNMVSELTPNTAKEMAVGAVATKDNINDSTALIGRWNLGHVDRLQELDTASASKGKNNDSVEKKLKVIYKKYYNYLVNTYFNFLSPTGPDIGTASSNAASLFKYDLAIKTKNGEIAGKGFIPVNLQITLEGLSGALLYQKFELTPNILPPSYDKGIEFIITSIDHNIVGNEWTTTYSTLSSPKARPIEGDTPSPNSFNTNAFSTLKIE